MAAGAVTHDLYAKLVNPSISDSLAARLCRYSTMAIAIGAMALATLVSVIAPERTIFWFAIFGW